MCAAFTFTLAERPRFAARIRNSAETKDSALHGQLSYQIWLLCPLNGDIAI